MHTLMTCGFAFDKTMEHVLLIRCMKPHMGSMYLRYNGLGGKFEPGETPRQCMVREFREECGIETTEEEWDDIAVLTFTSRTDYPDVFREGEAKTDVTFRHVHFFAASLPAERLHGYVQKEEGPLQLTPVAEAMLSGSPDYMPNLSWLLPLARLSKVPGTPTPLRGGVSS